MRMPQRRTNSPHQPGKKHVPTTCPAKRPLGNRRLATSGWKSWGGARTITIPSPPRAYNLGTGALKGPVKASTWILGGLGNHHKYTDSTETGIIPILPRDDLLSPLGAGSAKVCFVSSRYPLELLRGQGPPILGCSLGT